jgi:hypothetical protein
MLKSKIHPRRGHESPEEEYRYSSALSLTLALDRSGRSTARAGGFTPGKTRYPSTGGWVDWSGRGRKTPSPPIFDPLIFQPVSSSYSDCAIKDHGKELER